mgnify:CR=1 FL=1
MSEELKTPDGVKSYNPLVDESVIENPNVTKTFATNVDYSNSRLEEQDFIPPPIEEKKVDTVSDQIKREPNIPLNQELNDLSQKDKMKAATVTANVILHGYSSIWGYANNLLKVSDRKIRRLEKEGKIESSSYIQFGEERLRVIDAFRRYNAMGHNPFTVSEEFKDEVRPILARVLAKKGIGMTDEQQLYYLFGKDIAEKAMMFWDGWKQRNDFINVIHESCQAFKNANTNINIKPQTNNEQFEEKQYENSNQNVEAVKEETVQVEVVKETLNQQDLTKDGFPKRRAGKKPKNESK